VLARAVVWGPLEVNPAKQGADNPQRRRTDKRPFESWEELEALAERLGPRLGPMVVFAGATGMRPGECGTISGSRRLEVQAFFQAPAVDVIRRDIGRAARLAGGKDSDRLQRLANQLRSA
jgi:hypothetical protein